MKYSPYLFSLEGELCALENQSFSTNIEPIINIIKEKKGNSKKTTILDTIKQIANTKVKNSFFITVPMNLDLKGNIKASVKNFYDKITNIPNYQSLILNSFVNEPNIIPILDVNLTRYTPGDLSRLYSSVTHNNLGYILYANSLTVTFHEISKLITSKDTLIYHLGNNSITDSKIINEIKMITSLKNSIGFNTILIKQIYDDLVFNKMPNGEILPSMPAYRCIDYNLYKNASSLKFNSFGDYAGIRNTPIKDIPLCYPAFIGLNTTSFNHFAFKGIKDNRKSYSCELLPKLLSSSYWTSVIPNSHKTSCYGCTKICNFASNNNLTKNNPVNSALAWKTITISHYLSLIDDLFAATIIT